MSDDELEIQDRTLLKRAIYEKDQYAQKYIYLKYKPAVRQFIKNAGKLDGYIDDLVHEVFVNICEGKCQYSGSTDVRGYLCGVAKNVAKYHIRREKRRARANLIYRNNASTKPNHPSNRANISENYRFDKFQETLHQAITKLPSKSREAVELVLIHKVKHHQAAKQLGCSSVVFRNRLHRGLKELRKKHRVGSNFLRL
jgi:RNA polymerase sigma-70 factor (ECF subfamily)